MTLAEASAKEVKEDDSERRSERAIEWQRRGGGGCRDGGRVVGRRESRRRSSSCDARVGQEVNIEVRPREGMAAEMHAHGRTHRQRVDARTHAHAQSRRSANSMPHIRRTVFALALEYLQQLRISRVTSQARVAIF
eukprot:2100823-Pleurochrysis_carterae.AAC.1